MKTFSRELFPCCLICSRSAVCRLDYSMLLKYSSFIVCVYFYDLRIASNCAEEPYGHLVMVFRHLDKYGSLIYPSYYQFGQAGVEFLCHLMMPEGIRQLPKSMDSSDFLNMNCSTRLGCLAYRALLFFLFACFRSELN